jgi:Leucine-rich repeat (LRR) protein
MRIAWTGAGLCLLLIITVSAQENANYVRRSQGLEEIPGDIPSDVMRIDLSVNRITSIQGNVLRDFNQLRELNVSHNSLSFIADDAFEGTQISSLWLGNNRLSGVPNLAAIGNTLEHFYASHNAITQVLSADFRGVSNLKTLYLDNNVIESFELGFDSPSNPLVYLVINKNRLTELSSAVFSGMAQLNYLNAEGNLLQSFPDLSLLPLSNNLQYLNLMENEIASIPEASLQRMTSLVSLHLSGNQITLMPELEAARKTLYELFISNNRVSDVPEGYFNGYQLQRIGLSANRLTSIPNISPLNSTLRYISLSDNDFSIATCQTVSDILSPMKQLQYLYMDNTRMKYFPDPRDLPQDFIDLWIYNGETMICDCAMLWLQEISEADSSVLDITYDSTPCGAPSSLRGNLWNEITIDDMCPG